MSEIGCLGDIHVSNLEVEQHCLLNSNQTITGNTHISGRITLTSGGAVSQLTSKSTNVTLNARSGKITTNNAELAANGIVTFDVLNNTITANDVILANHVSGGTLGSYVININTINNNSFRVTISNISSTARSEILVINFAAFTATLS